MLLIATLSAMRKYAPIWKTIKDKGTCTIKATPDMHARIKQAVIKEKHNDAVFQLLSAEAGKLFKLKIETNVQNGTMTFSLEEEGEITVELLGGL